MKTNAFIESFTNNLSKNWDHKWMRKVFLIMFYISVIKWIIIHSILIFNDMTMLWFKSYKHTIVNIYCQHRYIHQLIDVKMQHDMWDFWWWYNEDNNHTYISIVFDHKEKTKKLIHSPKYDVFVCKLGVIPSYELWFHYTTLFS